MKLMCTRHHSECPSLHPTLPERERGTFLYGTSQAPRGGAAECLHHAQEEELLIIIVV